MSLLMYLKWSDNCELDHPLVCVLLKLFTSMLPITKALQTYPPKTKPYRVIVYYQPNLSINFVVNFIFTVLLLFELKFCLDCLTLVRYMNNYTRANGKMLSISPFTEIAGLELRRIQLQSVVV